MRKSLFVLALLAIGCGGDKPAVTPIHALDTSAKNGESKYISWREHIVEDEASSGIKLRGAVALAAADLNQDGFVDLVSAFRDAKFLRVAYGDESADDWFRLSLAEDDEVRGVSDVAIGDVSGDGWPDVVAATEDGVLYLKNPAQKNPGFRWEREKVGSGPFTRVGLADLKGDGRLELIAAGNGSVVWFDSDGWTMHEIGEGSEARVADFDGDGDSDVFAGSAWFAWNDADFERHAADEDLSGAAALGDLNGDGRADVVVCRDAEYAWFEQSTDGKWTRHAIGSIAPDVAVGAALADIDGDGDLDLLAGSASAGPTDEDGEDLTVASRLGRLAWFQNPGSLGGDWERHDIVRRKRGIFPAFVPRDMDGDGDLDFLGVRSGSGEFDGVYWMQQLHSDEPVVRFQPAREEESEPVALPK